MFAQSWRRALIMVVALAFAAVATPVQAQRPWQSMQLFKRIEADPNNSFTL
ncbi:MAG: hypothetical protein JNM18_19625, partial [Planctomycetaceae bacterium]|nr:hypothetical protein [Planctomycetaceae bacterium]